jgi:UMF1 family MFS transporter
MNIATLYFAVWLVSDLGASNTMVALGNGISSALIALSIPLFGAISDATQRRKPWVVWFTILACAATAAMGIIGQTIVPLIGDSVRDPVTTGYTIGGGVAVIIVASFVLANYAYQGALPFYNAMMFELVPYNEQGRLSGMGTALGYFGAIVGVLLVTPFFSGSMPLLGNIPAGTMDFLRSVMPFTSHGGRVSTFVPTAVLFFSFLFLSLSTVKTITPGPGSRQFRGKLPSRKLFTRSVMQRNIRVPCVSSSRHFCTRMQ